MMILNKIIEASKFKFNDDELWTNQGKQRRTEQVNNDDYINPENLYSYLNGYYSSTDTDGRKDLIEDKMAGTIGTVFINDDGSVLELWHTPGYETEENIIPIDIINSVGTHYDSFEFDLTPYKGNKRAQLKAFQKFVQNFSNEYFSRGLGTHGNFSGVVSNFENITKV